MGQSGDAPLSSVAIQLSIYFSQLPLSVFPEDEKRASTGAELAVESVHTLAECCMGAVPFLNWEYWEYMTVGHRGVQEESL